MNLTCHKKTALLLLVLLLCLAAAGCGKSGDPAAIETAPAAEPLEIGGQSLSPDTTDLTAVLSAGETAQLDKLPNLHFADLSGSENVEEISAWAKAHPDISVKYTVTLPDGTVLPSDTRSVDFSAASGSDALAAAPALSLLQNLKILKLGRERSSVSWDDIRKLREFLPETSFQYSFDLYGKECDLSSSTISLFHIPVEDNAERIDLVMSCMPQLTYVDMDSCGVSNERMEELHLKYPDVKIVWRVWFGEAYSVRTDVVRILASKPSVGGMLDNNDAKILYYCHDVRFLDLGHNKALSDYSFVRGMPKLEVAVLSMCDCSDMSPLADCPELEYLEIFSTECSDLTPLKNLTKLRHLNIANNLGITDLSPLYGLKDLERLWIGSWTVLTNEQIAEMQRHVPKCEINTTVYADPTADGWRYVVIDGESYMAERYYVLRLQFDDYKFSSYSFSRNDPLCPS